MPPEKGTPGNNEELAKALAQFEASQDAKAMSGTQNSPDIADVLHNTASKSVPLPTKSKMVEKVIQYSGGMVKTEEQANYVLLFIALLFFLLSIYFFFFWGGQSAVRSTSRPVRDINSVNKP